MKKQRRPAQPPKAVQKRCACGCGAEASGEFGVALFPPGTGARRTLLEQLKVRAGRWALLGARRGALARPPHAPAPVLRSAWCSA